MALLTIPWDIGLLPDENNQNCNKSDFEKQVPACVKTTVN